MKAKKLLSLFITLSMLMVLTIPFGTIVRADESASKIALTGPSLTQEIAAGSRIYRVTTGITVTSPSPDSEGNSPFGINTTVQVYKNNEWTDYDKNRFEEGTYRLKLHIYTSSDCNIRYRIPQGVTVTYNGTSCSSEVPAGILYAAYAYTEEFTVVPTKNYGLRIAGEQVTNANAQDILENGVFAYDDTTKTLTVNGNCTSEKHIIYSSIKGLTVNVAGDSVLICNGQNAAIYCIEDTKITGSGKLTAGAANSDGIVSFGTSTLTIDDADIEASGREGIRGASGSETLVIKNSKVLAGGMDGALHMFGSITLEGCSLQGGRIGSTGSYAMAVDANGNRAILVLILPDSGSAHKAEGIIGVAEDAEETTVRVYVNDLPQDKPATVIATQYKNGILTGARNAAVETLLPGDAVEFKFDTETDAVYRAYVWDKDQRPLADKVTYSKLEITDKPKNADVWVGEDAPFTVQVSGGRAPYTYEWYYRYYDDAKFYKCRDKAEYYEWFIGIDTNTLTVHQLDETLEGSLYYCVITDADGNSVTTNTAVLNAHLHVLSITGANTERTVAKGEDAWFAVGLNGGGRKPLTFEWYYRYKDGEKFYKCKDKAEWYEWFDIENDDYMPSIHVHQHDDSLEGSQYYCVITDAKGYSVTSPVATLNVIE